MKIKRGHQEGKHNGERWMISYADMLTLLLVVFIALYAISALNKAKLKKLDQSILKAFHGTPSKINNLPPSPHGPMNNQPAAIPVPIQAPAVHPKPGQSKSDRMQGVPHQSSIPEPVSKRIRDEIKAMRKLDQDLEVLLKPEIKSHKVSLITTPLSLRIRLNSSVLFLKGQANLTSPASQMLTGLSKVLVKIPHTYRISIQGYTDNTPIHTQQFNSNWSLSAERAVTVVQLFYTQGIQGNQMVAEGFSKFSPVASNDTSEGRAENRRVEILINVPKVSNNANSDQTQNIPAGNGSVSGMGSNGSSPKP